MTALIRTLALSLSATLFAAPPVFAAESDAVDYVREQLATLSGMPVIHSAIAETNMRHDGLDNAAILEMDETWRAEVGAPNATLIPEILNSEASDALRDLVEASGGRITEIILMDALGLHVAVSATTSDYWQGDEAKHSETYPMGPEAVFVDEIEYDESSGMYQQQVSATIVDPDTQEPIGAITFGLDASAFN